MRLRAGYSIRLKRGFQVTMKNAIVRRGTSGFKAPAQPTGIGVLSPSSITLGVYRQALSTVREKGSCIEQSLVLREHASLVKELARTS